MLDLDAEGDKFAANSGPKTAEKTKILLKLNFLQIIPSQMEDLHWRCSIATTSSDDSNEFFKFKDSKNF